MTKFYIEPKNLDKWMKQNEADYIGNFVDGALLDNFMLFTKNGIAAVYEHYLNAWSSDYYVEFERGDGDKVWDNWYAFEARMTV